MSRAPLALWIATAIVLCGGVAAPYVQTDTASATPKTRKATKRPCDARVEDKASPGIPYADWRAAWLGLRGEEWADAVPPATEEEARAALCANGECSASGPWLVRTGDSFGHYHVLIPQPDGAGLLGFPHLSCFMDGRCPFGASLSLFRSGKRLHVSGSVVVDDMVYVTSDARGALVACEPGSPDCMTACFATSATDLDFVFDLATGERILAVERARQAKTKAPYKLTEEFSQEVAFSLRGNTVTLSGPRCQTEITLP